MISSEGKTYFTFEGRQFYAQMNAPGYVGTMIFTGAGAPCQKAFHPELWMFYEHQNNFNQLKNSEIF